MSELAKALVEVQANLPKIVKGETAKVPTKNGESYTYTYADLADVSDEILPLLTKHGLAFTAMPTVRDDGKFVLAYSLLHVSGEREDGSYLLPVNGTPQQVGSAITYARRYCLCAVVGVAPEDDDGRAAEQAARAPAPEPVDLAPLEAAIVTAQDVGIDKDWDELRRYAGQSVDHRDFVIDKVKTAVAEVGA